MSHDPAVRFFQALGDETRLDLLTKLTDGERTVGELVDALNCPQPKVSRHLKVLKDAGLVVDRRDGRHVTYALTTRRMWNRAAREWLALLDAGFPPRPGAGDAVPLRTEPARTSPPRTSSPRTSPARTSPARTAPSRTEPAGVRRPRMETHLL